MYSSAPVVDPPIQWNRIFHWHPACQSLSDGRTSLSDAQPGLAPGPADSVAASWPIIGVTGHRTLTVVTGSRPIRARPAARRRPIRSKDSGIRGAARRGGRGCGRHRHTELKKASEMRVNYIQMKKFDNRETAEILSRRLPGETKLA
eukprot:768626-Hanusia_phi.AAC.6